MRERERSSSILTVSIEGWHGFVVSSLVVGICVTSPHLHQSRRGCERELVSAAASRGAPTTQQPRSNQSPVPGGDEERRQRMNTRRKLVGCFLCSVPGTFWVIFLGEHNKENGVGAGLRIERFQKNGATRVLGAVSCLPPPHRRRSCRIKTNKSNQVVSQAVRRKSQERTSGYSYTQGMHKRVVRPACPLACRRHNKTSTNRTFFNHHPGGTGFDAVYACPLSYRLPYFPNFGEKRKVANAGSSGALTAFSLPPAELQELQHPMP